MKNSNALINETSPYLLQHAYNPVDWYPWNDQTLSKALESNKMLLISIGYSSCHWCHVMEKESFEDERVAKLMNEHFLCIKVDREERPDVDQVYMQAVQLISGTGGWPLNCFALPDGRPVWGGTYFPKETWIEILTQISHMYQIRSDEILNCANQLTQGIRKDDWFGSQVVDTKGFELTDLEIAFHNAKCRFDWKKGGTTGSPKFPMPASLLYLLRFHHLSKNQEALDLARLTLTHMARGGIYDQLGGGFARYSIDPSWKVPHFEKMLYDNAQLISVYSEAYRMQPLDLYLQVLTQSIRFIREEMTAPEGWFFSALDADTQGQEGMYYTWTVDKIKAALGDEAGFAMDYFQTSAEGNWEDGLNVLLRPEDDASFAVKWGIPAGEMNQRISSIRARLQKEREKRVRPGTDDKLITAWNALMIKGLVDASQALSNPELIKDAIRAMEFLLLHLKTPSGGLWRTYKAGKAKIEGFLDDYAATADALLALYQVTFNRRWLDEAIKIVEYVLVHFKDTDSGMFFYTMDQELSLVARKFEWIDTVIPSSNSMMARVLYVLGHILDHPQYKERSVNMAHRMKDHMVRHITSFAGWGLLALDMVSPYKVIAITGKDAIQKLHELSEYYYPWKAVVGSTSPADWGYLKNRWVDKETLIHICTRDACLMPVKEVSQAIASLR